MHLGVGTFADKKTQDMFQLHNDPGKVIMGHKVKVNVEVIWKCLNPGICIPCTDNVTYNMCRSYRKV